MDSKTRESVLVMVEGEAVCPFWMNHWGAVPADGWNILEQEEWEPTVDFSERLHATLARAAADTDGPTTIILVASGNTEPRAMAARWQLSAEIMNHLSACGGGRVLITRGYGHDGRPEPALEALVADLLEEWSDAGIDVRICLDNKPPASQVRSSSPAAARTLRPSEAAAQAF